MGSISDNEKEFVKAVGNLEFKVDTDKIWQNVSPHLVRKKKERKFGFYFLGLFLALLLGISSTYLFMQSENNKLNALNVVDVPASQENSVTHLTKGDFVKDSNNLTSAESIMSSGAVTSDSKVNKSGLSGMIDSRTSSGNSLNENIYSNNLKEAQKITNKNGKLNLNLNNVSSNTILNIGKPLNQTIASGNIEDVTKTLENKSIQALTNEFKIGDRKNKAMESVELLSVLSSTLITKNNLFDLDDRMQVIKILQEDSNKWRPFYTIKLGSNRTIVSSQLVAATDFEESTFEKENGVVGFATDLLVGFENNKGWRLFGGLSIYNQVSSFSDFSASTETSTVPGTNQHINTFGETVEVSTSLSRVVQTYNDVQWHRKHLYADVNVGIGKVLKTIGPLAVSADVFFKYNVMSQHSGFYFDETSGSIIKFEGSQDNIYKSSNGLSTSVAFNVEWNLGKTSVGISPYYAKRFNSIINNNNFYKTKDNHVGLQFNLTYRPF